MSRGKMKKILIFLDTGRKKAYNMLASKSDDRGGKPKGCR